MIKNNTPSKLDNRLRTPLLAAVVFRLPLIVMVACFVASFGSYESGSKEQRPTDKPATSKTLGATEGVEHLDRLARVPMVVELSDGKLFVAGLRQRPGKES